MPLQLVTATPLAGVGRRVATGVVRLAAGPRAVEARGVLEGAALQLVRALADHGAGDRALVSAGGPPPHPRVGRPGHGGQGLGAVGRVALIRAGAEPDVGGVRNLGRDEVVDVGVRDRRQVARLSLETQQLRCRIGRGPADVAAGDVLVEVLVGREVVVAGLRDHRGQADLGGTGRVGGELHRGQAGVEGRLQTVDGDGRGTAPRVAVGQRQSGLGRHREGSGVGRHSDLQRVSGVARDREPGECGGRGRGDANGRRRRQSQDRIGRGSGRERHSDGQRKDSGEECSQESKAGRAVLGRRVKPVHG